LLLLSRVRFSKLSLFDLRLWFFVYAVLFSISLAWSFFPLNTAGRALELMVATGIILQIPKDRYTLQRLEGIYRLTLLIITLLMAVTVVGYVMGIQLFVKQGGHALFTSTSAESPFFSGNGLGYASISLLLVAFAEWEFCGVKGLVGVAQFVFAVTAYVFASSRTSLGILLLGVAVIFFRRSKLLFIGFSIAVGLGLFLFWGKIVQHLQGNESQGSFDTLDGRLVMWTAAFQEWKKRPLFGYGGSVGGRYVLSHSGIPSMENLTYLHSGIMETLTGLGIVGLSLVLFLLVWVTIRTVRAGKKYPSFSGLYIWIITFWITSIMSNGVLDTMGPWIAVYLVLIAHLDYLRKPPPDAEFQIVPGALRNNFVREQIGKWQASRCG
jgi:O-antigen ligase